MVGLVAEQPRDEQGEAGDEGGEQQCHDHGDEEGYEGLNDPLDSVFRIYFR